MLHDLREIFLLYLQGEKIMELFHLSSLISGRIDRLRESGKTIGFVPTMGALHEGHLSLVRLCRQQNDFVVASIFVNPTQFNDKEDLRRYPRTPEKDLEMLGSAGCDIVFLPGEKEIYPEPDQRQFDFGNLGSILEGERRPGHFNGVAQVVTRLFDIIKPQRAYFGLKDFQQLAIIKKVTTDLHYPVEIVPCPIVREPDGLAMSSRNMLLQPEERITALELSQSLFQAGKMKETHAPAAVRQWVVEHLSTVPGISLEYFEIVSSRDLLPVDSWNGPDPVIGCLAARVGRIRLIDNINFSL
jgi:pantoate--beta-alanine ligase